MSNSIFPTSEAVARREARPSPRRRLLAGRAVLAIGAAALQCACSLLIQFDDGEPDAPDASITREPNQPTEPDRDAGAGSAPQALDSAHDAGDAVASDVAVAPTSEPPLVLAFIERPAEGEATLRIADARAALLPQPETDVPAWRRSLHPSTQAGDVLDFAWSPDGRRIAVRHETLDGPRLTLFEAPDWRELPLATGASPANQPRLSAGARYRWSPDGAALAVELASADGPFIGGYVIVDSAARELNPVAFGGPVETLGWLSPSWLFVIQPEAGEPELLELGLSEGVFSRPVARVLLGAFFPIELRHAAGGLIGASTDPTNFVFFWPATSGAGFETAFTPSAYLSSRDSFAAEPDDGAGTSTLFPIGDSSRVLDALPRCPVVLAWSEGRAAGSLAGASIACLTTTDTAAALTVYAYDATGKRTARSLDDATLLADLASASNWEGQARALAEDGSWLVIATVQHDVIVDLRGPTPRYDVRPAASAASTSRAFAPSSRFVLQQRGRQVELTVLVAAAQAGTAEAAAGQPPLHLPLPDAALDLPLCDSARHVESYCGSPRAAGRAAARWSVSADVASLLTADEGLVVLAPTADGVGFRHMPVSTCGSGCVTQYDFSE